jgi:pimeloyl-ACP methyl ester carboxylesterase
MKTTLLLLHGALGNKSQLEPIARHLPVDLPVQSLDFPGHGGRPATEDYSIPYFARAVLEHMDAHRIDRADLFGYSMGGYVALYLASTHPDRVRRIATLGTKLDWTPETAAREIGMLDPDKIALKVPQFAEALAQRHAPADWKQVLRQTAAMLAALGNGAALTAPAFQAISAPVDIWLGELDNMVTAAESEAVAAMLADGRFEILPGARHPLDLVDPAMLAGRLEKWLSV